MHSTYVGVIAQHILGDPTSAEPHHSVLLSNEQRSRVVEVASSGWKFQYQQRCIATEEVLVDIEGALPQEDVFEMLTAGFASAEPDRFPFPVASSDNLERFAVLRTVITLLRDGDGPDTTGATTAATRSGKFRIQRLSRPGAHKAAIGSPAFSPNGKTLVFSAGRSQAGCQIERRVIEVWSEEVLGGPDVEFHCRGTVHSSWLAAGSPRSDDQMLGFVLHPIYPILVFPEWTRVSAWWFLHQGTLN